MSRFASLVALLLGAAAATGFAPLDWWPVTLIAVAAWLWLVHDATCLKQALWRGWVFGVGHFSINNNWIQHAFTYQDKMPHWLGYAAPIALALYLAVYPAIAAGLAWKFASARGVGNPTARPDARFALVAGAAWIATEYLRSTMFTGYAWDSLGVIWVAVPPIAHAATWVGTYALSGLTIVLAGALMLLAARRWAMPAVVAGATAIVAGLGLVAPAPPAPAADAPRVRVVQPNLGLEAREGSDYDESSFRTLLGLSGTPGAVPRLVLWPEGALRYLLEDGYPAQYYWGSTAAFARMRIAARLGPDDVLLTGGDGLIFDPAGQLTMATNSIFAVDGDGRLRGRYDKAHLVPYGEYLPLRSILGPLGLARLVPGDVDFRPGPGPRNLTLPGFGAIGGQVCYEIVFSGQVVNRQQRPAILFNPSNDAWFGSWGPPQHLAQARMRAIEEGLPILRSTPTGISAVIGADGRLIGTLPPHQAGAIEVAMPQPLPPTLFARAGNWMAGLIAGLLVALAVAIARRSH
ncbi:apolipoprotein N-acyltransferase [Hephaestia sp. GCM10023244]|uniref:apolipoprotein N-acyltransferase n=1 Tax=unclassified Hephaestia TaxID=2631281 RepID=UPI0020773B57|nr:apolipoprotein N-acyltransferase [Hephaestia sp. MAHUQ-44]MCM8730762.1 apolipoprotein N-acyltransferase [Hephaestia sp. MAHUQ-44]